MVMAIVNVTPDSFFEGSRFNNSNNLDVYLKDCKKLGVHFIDVGAQSTRPGSDPVSCDEQIERLTPMLSHINKNYPEFYISLDTSSPKVAEWGFQNGVDLINDVEGGRNHPEIWKVCAKHHAPYILMHSRGTANSLHDPHKYENVTTEVIQELAENLVKIKEAGVVDVIIDPGFGFSKDTRVNFKLLKDLGLFQMLGHPVLCGISRKSMIYKTLEKGADSALNGTTILNTFAILNGAQFLRVHDPEEAMEIMKLLIDD